jgi:hypothetical protein
MGDARKPAALDEHDKKLDPQNFAYISDDTYTVDEVEAQTQVRLAVTYRAGVGGRRLVCMCRCFSRA